MIYNIVDERERKYRWKSINAIIEATWHDNSCDDTDITEGVSAEIEVTYEQRERISLKDAIDWAHGNPCPVTLYLYDEGKGTVIE